MVLTGIVVLTVVLPLAVASAGPTGGEAPASAHQPEKTSDDTARASGRRASPGERASDEHASGDRDASDRGRGGRGPGGRGAEGHVSGEAPVSGRADGRAPKAGSAEPRSPLTLGVGLATAARCGPESTSPDGVEAQTCVLTQGRETWARTYYRNATGDDLTSVLTLMAPGDRTVRMHCAVAEDDEPGACETPRERTVGEASAYTAVAEFADGADGPLLLRSGSNSPAQTVR
ncbi:hypothetical protein AB0D14_12620 [Streptomyces sp. NPDC048484]|uniref:hypothetical protein n=1 Tax=Streptomyces sp. NPDC048484 TaxID=3155146 RepID=UPI0034223210